MAILIGAAIAAGVGILGKATSTIIQNKRNGDLAEDLSENLDAQAGAVNEQNALALQELESIKAGNVPIPIQRTNPEDILIGETAYDAFDDAQSDQALKNFVNAADAGLSQRVAATSGNSRIASAVAAKATEDYKRSIKETSDDLAEKKREAKLAVGAMETEVNKVNAANQLTADRDYASFKNEFMADEYERQQTRADDFAQQARELEYQSIEIPGMASVQNAANTGQMFGDVAAIGVQAMGVAEKGAKLPSAEDGTKLDAGDRFAQFQGQIAQLSGANTMTSADIKDAIDNAKDKAMEREEKRAKEAAYEESVKKNREAFEADKMKITESLNPMNELGELISSNRPQIADIPAVKQEGGIMSDSLFAKENGGQVDMTDGEFNHGSLDKPETGNDQALIDEEDLMTLVNSGKQLDYKRDIEPLVKIKTTGEELVLNNEQTRNLELKTLATDPELQDGMMAMARNGVKMLKPGGRTAEEIRFAEKDLAKFMRSLLAQPQFQRNA